MHTKLLERTVLPNSLEIVSYCQILNANMVGIININITNGLEILSNGFRQTVDICFEVPSPCQ